MADYIRPVVFTLGGQKFGVDINLVQSIERQVDVVPVPNAMKYISGIFNLRGEVIPVMSLKKKFSMDDTAESKGNNTVIVNLPDMKIALEVDEVLEIGELNAEKIVKTISGRVLPTMVSIDNRKRYAAKPASHTMMLQMSTALFALSFLRMKKSAI